MSEIDIRDCSDEGTGVCWGVCPHDTNYVANHCPIKEKADEARRIIEANHDEREV